MKRLRNYLANVIKVIHSSELLLSSTGINQSRKQNRNVKDCEHSDHQLRALIVESLEDYNF